LPVYSLPITFLILLAIMLIRYFVLVGGAYWLSQKFGSHRIETVEISKTQVRRDIYWSIVSTIIFAISGTILIRLWQMGKIAIYLEANKFGWAYLVISLPLLLFLHDLYFYWTHKMLHRPFFFKHVHRIHHESRVPTAWTAFSFHPVEAIIQAIILPVLIFIVPVHIVVLMIFLTLMTMLGIINHLGYEFYPSRFRSQKPFSFIISATHHQAHHKRVHVNYGLYFNWWDLWMKTEAKVEK
jgi:lathosterol oxidase